jgi:hypothetical protein
MPSKRCNDTQVIFGLTLVVQLDFNVDFAVNLNHSLILDCEVIIGYLFKPLILFTL